MIAAQGLHWFDRQPQGPRWPSFGFAAAVTLVLFIGAFVSMRSIGPWAESEREPAPPPVVIPLQTPPAVPRPVEQPINPPRVTTREPVEQVQPTPAPQRLAPPIVVPIAPPIIAPVSPTIPTDTARARPGLPQIPTTPIVRPHNYGLPDTAMAIRGGAPYAPAGVTIASRTKNTAKLRDSILGEKLALIPQLARTTPMSAEGAATIGQSQAQARMLAQRSTSSGNWRDVRVPMGEGVGGVGAINGGKTGVHMDSRGASVTIPFPLFSPGPSPEERKRNEKLHAEYLAYLRREGDVILLKRDSIRADSLRRDSLAKRRP